MTRLVDLPTLAALVRGMGPERFLCELADEIQASFLRWDDYDKSARLASHGPTGVIELMPVADERLYSFKYVNGHPGNPALGLPTVMAFGMLAEVATGLPLLLSELTLATALRTAATSALNVEPTADFAALISTLLDAGALIPTDSRTG